MFPCYPVRRNAAGFFSMHQRVILFFQTTMDIKIIPENIKQGLMFSPDLFTPEKLKVFDSNSNYLGCIEEYSSGFRAFNVNHKAYINEKVENCIMFLKSGEMPIKPKKKVLDLNQKSLF